MTGSFRLLYYTSSGVEQLNRSIPIGNNKSMPVVAVKNKYQVASPSVYGSNLVSTAAICWRQEWSVARSRTLLRSSWIEFLLARRSFNNSSSRREKTLQSG